ncbi:MAG: hypothetical protein IPH07_10010 [Deltaproteobacteria bacterium]|nr:hypothetical protein [Deltaproteobacteria bacterium]MBK8718767.1 hypothetical protein [Deltaproteobacteria bacterium]MBP7286480.1 hypothetical protein [Nannocystaceae bacterium]
MAESESTPQAYPVAFSGKLIDFFPSTDERSAWMLRLAILRDDMGHELGKLGVRQDASDEETWVSSYTLRKIAITIAEVRRLFGTQVATWLKKSRSRYSPAFLKQFAEFRRRIDAGYNATKTIRDKLGAHLDLCEDPEAVISAHAKLPCRARIDLSNAANTSLRPLTINSLLFATPEAKTLKEVQELQSKTAQAVIQAISPIVHGIDTLLYIFWNENHVGASRADGGDGPLAVLPDGREVRVRRPAKQAEAKTGRPKWSRRKKRGDST